MKRPSRPDEMVMSPDAFAGFLKLWLTPPSRLPERSADVDAYVDFLNRRAPLSETVRQVLGHTSERAA